MRRRKQRTEMKKKRKMTMMMPRKEPRCVEDAFLVVLFDVKEGKQEETKQQQCHPNHSGLCYLLSHLKVCLLLE